MDEIKIPFDVANAPGANPEQETKIRSELSDAITATQKRYTARCISPDDVFDAIRQLYDIGMSGPASIGIVIDWDVNAGTFQKDYFLKARGLGTPDSTHIRLRIFGKGVNVSFFRARTARIKMKIEAGRGNAAECVLRKVEIGFRCAYKKEEKP